MNNLDKQYTDLLQDILDNGVTKSDRTGTGTLSVFGRQIRHKMSEGFPLITTKKMPFRLIATELMWFLRGDTNIKFLVDNNCHIWDGDSYKNYCKIAGSIEEPDYSVHVDDPNQNCTRLMTMEEFIGKIKTDDEFVKKWGDLGSVYGKQWRSWNRNATRDEKIVDPGVYTKQIDQIQNLINDLKTNPDSRRLIVSAWNPADLPHQVLPPCHYGFQVYTRELSLSERTEYKKKRDGISRTFAPYTHQMLDNSNIPTRAISLMWSQRSCDIFLGIPFNIASYGLLLEIIAKSVNMVPDELIGNLGDTHLYLTHVEQAKEQIGRELDLDERREMVTQEMFNQIYNGGDSNTLSHSEIDQWNVPTRTREPYTLPTLNINTEFWPTESGECGIGLLDAIKIFNSFTNDNFCKCLLEEDIQLSNYRSHEKIKAPLSN